jgi:hypothetical protein
MPSRPLSADTTAVVKLQAESSRVDTGTGELVRVGAFIGECKMPEELAKVVDLAEAGRGRRGKRRGPTGRGRTAPIAEMRSHASWVSLCRCLRGARLAAGES